jgi:hypothetical protein
MPRSGGCFGLCLFSTAADILDGLPAFSCYQANSSLIVGHAEIVSKQKQERLYKSTMTECACF